MLFYENSSKGGFSVMLTCKYLVQQLGVFGSLLLRP